jgi:cytochrome c
MKATVLVFAAAAALVAGTANADMDTAQLKAKGCLGCHDVDKKKVGPALKDVAAKYKADKGAQEKIVAKMKSGKGHPKVNASDDELKKLVGDVLAAK